MRTSLFTNMFSIIVKITNNLYNLYNISTKCVYGPICLQFGYFVVLGYVQLCPNPLLTLQFQILFLSVLPAPGPDEIPSEALKVFSVNPRFFLKTNNICLSAGVFPTHWKIIFVLISKEKVILAYRLRAGLDACWTWR